MTQLVDRSLRHLVVLAHQDDDLAYGGLLSRLAGSVDVVYVTNGDGLAPEEGAEPRAYAEMRQAEAQDALEVAGIDRARVRFLGYSEIEIYDRLVDVTETPGHFGAIAAYFQEMAAAVTREVTRVAPDVVWSSAYQQGHPEHDLVHVMAATAAWASSPAVTMCALPQYELTILVPLRFPPWRRGEVHELTLTPAEVDLKLRMGEAYGSQGKIISAFQRVIGALGGVGRLVGRGFTLEEYLARETFAVVPRDYDYLRSCQAHETLNYMRERHRGVKVRFDHHVQPVVAALLAAAGAAR